MTETHRRLLRLALAACDRGDALGARALVIATLETPDEPERSGDAPAAESYAAFGGRVGVSTRTVRAMIRDGRIPSSAVVGSGRGRRVLLAEALDALRNEKPSTSSAEDAGAAYVEARRKLRVVGGGS